MLLLSKTFLWACKILLWAAANGGVTSGGLRGVWPPFLEIGRNRPFSPFSALSAVFWRVQRAPGKSRKQRKKAFFLRYPRICLNPTLLNPRLRHSNYQKNPRVRKIRVRNSGAGNGCANFMDTWKKCVLSAGKTMSVKFPFFGGGGGECRFYFYGRADFSEIAYWAIFKRIR